MRNKELGFGLWSPVALFGANSSGQRRTATKDAGGRTLGRRTLGQRTTQDSQHKDEEEDEQEGGQWRQRLFDATVLATGPPSPAKSSRPRCFYPTEGTPRPPARMGNRHSSAAAAEPRTVTFHGPAIDEEQYTLRVRTGRPLAVLPLPSTPKALMHSCGRRFRSAWTPQFTESFLQRLQQEQQLQQLAAQRQQQLEPAARRSGPAAELAEEPESEAPKPAERPRGGRRIKQEELDQMIEQARLQVRSPGGRLSEPTMCTC